MLIAIQKRFIFIANPKTGSTAVESTLKDSAEIQRNGSPGRKHTHYHWALREYDFLFSLPQFNPASFTRFAVMRDPVDWIYSWYRYRKSEKVLKPIPPDMNFPSFWEQADWSIQRDEGKPNLQKARLVDGDGKVAMDVVLQYHDLAEQYAQLAGLLGLPTTLGRVNVSTSKGSRNDIDPGLRREIADFFKEDYELFDSLTERNRIGFEKLAAVHAE